MSASFLRAVEARAADAVQSASTVSVPKTRDVRQLAAGSAFEPPPDLIACIAMHASVKAVGRMLQTSKLWAEVCKSDFVWAEKIAARWPQTEL